MIKVRQDAPLIWVVTGVNLMSLLDAINTILILGNDSSGELNLLMRALIDRNLSYFFTLKLAMTLSGTLICWHYYDRKRSARQTLVWISRAYCGVMVWQALLLSGAMIHPWAF